MTIGSLRIGAKAPDFQVMGVIDSQKPREYALSDYAGKWVVLFFYPLDFSIVCPTEVREFSQRFDEFDHYGASVLGISADSIESHRRWIADLGEIRYPLLADTERHACESYGTLAIEGKISLRGTFIIDPEGRLRYALYHDNAIGRSVSETLRVLAALRTGEMCPAEWKPGEATLGFGNDVRD